MRWLYALAGVDVPVRYVVATVLQLGIASGVGLMLIMQAQVALRDDREAMYATRRK